ncbi:MAG: hypothetical protein OK455_04870, partial [Thaumarchaeota archaeon]|nr:hypothetical protein [Nitrososphaerota archaeon]
MTNTRIGAVVKVLTIVPIVAAVYYTNLQGWAQSIFASPQNFLFFVFACSVLAFGVVIKIAILRAKVELSRTSFMWGLVFLSGSVALYVYGAYSPDLLWYRYESLFLMVISYASFRIGTSILRALAPLLVVFAFFSYIPFSLFSVNPYVFLAASWLVVGLAVLKFSNFRLRSLPIPISMVSIAFVTWNYTQNLQVRLPLYAALTPAIVLIFLAIPSVRRFAFPPPFSGGDVCARHHPLGNGFCAACGRKVGPSLRHENLGIGGLLALVIVAGLLLFSTVPILSIEKGVPHDSYYSAQGTTGVVTPLTPAGWQVNSSTILHTDKAVVYELKQAMVPIDQPEAKNYTMYYEVSYNIPVTGVPTGDIPGWTRLPTQYTSVGPFQGDLTSYTQGGDTLLIYNGRTTETFFSGSFFSNDYVGISFVREFKNTNVAADTTQFLRDLNTNWVPAFTTDLYYSSWTSFLNS